MQTTEQATKNVETLKEAHDNFNNRDYDALKQKVADDITYHDHGRERIFRGRDEFMEAWLQAWADTFSDGRIEERTYIDGGDTVVLKAIARGTNDGQFGSLPATNKPAEFAVCEIVRFNEEGKLIWGEAFYDTMTILKQLGHIQPPPDGQRQ